MKSDDEDRDDPRNVGFIQTPGAANSPRRLNRIIICVTVDQYWLSISLISHNLCMIWSFRDDFRNVGFIQTPGAADSPRRLHRIIICVTVQQFWL